MSSTNYNEEKISQGRKDFYNFFTEHDRRREKNFLHTFSEMTDFFDLCRIEATRV